MATLAERARKLSIQIKSLAGSQASEQEAKGFETRAGELSAAADSIYIPARLMKSFTAMAIKVEVSATTSSRLKRVVDETTVKYEKEPTSILEPDPEWRLATRRQLADLGARTTGQLLEAWQMYVLAKKPDIELVHIRNWESSPAYQEQARGVAALLAEFDEIAQRLPSSQGELDRPERLATELAERTRDLPTGYPEPVNDLYLAISQGTATAAHLTDEALEWLRENGQLQDLRISLKSDTPWRSA